MAADMVCQRMGQQWGTQKQVTTSTPSSGAARRWHRWPDAEIGIRIQHHTYFQWVNRGGVGIEYGLAALGHTPRGAHSKPAALQVRLQAFLTYMGGVAVGA